MSATAEWADNDRGRERRQGCGWRRDGSRGGAPWRPIELVAMILGFIVFWPIGLTILGLKIWQKKTGYQGDMVGFAQTQFEEMRGRSRSNWESVQRIWRDAARIGAAPAAPATAPSTNGRRSKLDRIEEERRRLDAAQREFGEYLAHLHMARDREEFERFKQERSAAQARGETGWRPFDEKPAGKTRPARLGPLRLFWNLNNRCRDGDAPLAAFSLART